jgi:hypothetical protein
MPQDKSVPQVVSELKELTVTYAKQETVEPLKGLTRFVGFGVGGSFLLGIGICLLALALLRLLQTETDDTFDAGLVWLPYFITVVPLALAGGLTVRAISKDHRRAR